MTLAVSPRARPLADRSPARAERDAGLLRDWLLGFYLAFMFAGGLPKLLHLEALEGVSAAAGSPLTQGVVLVVFFGAVVSVATRGVGWSEIARGARPFVLPLLLVVVSVAWASHQGVASRRILRLLIEFAAVLLLASSYRDPDRLLRVIWTTFAVLLVADLALIAAPSLSYTPLGYAGVHAHKNQLGTFAFAAFPVFFLVALQRSPLRLISLALCAATVLLLVMSRSKTPLAVIPVSGAIAFSLLWLRRRPARWQAILVVLAGWLALLLAAAVLLDRLDWRDAAAGAGLDPTLTGRTQIWNYVIWRASEAPLLGSGYGSFWLTEGINSDVTGDLSRRYGVEFVLTQAHNGYLDVLVQLGWVGCVALALMLFGIVAGLLKAAGRTPAPAMIALALYATVGTCFYNLSESSFLRAGQSVWIFLLLVVFAALKTSRPDAREDAPGPGSVGPAGRPALRARRAV